MLAYGNVLVRYACADAAMGATSATTATSATRTPRPRLRHASCLLPPPREQGDCAEDEPDDAHDEGDDREQRRPLPPPSEAFASIVGAGFSDDSEPFQSTIEPSE